MGKKGAALRAMKAAKVTRTFTEEQLREHDRQVEIAYKERYDKILRKQWDEYDREQRERDQKRKEEFDRHADEVWERLTNEFHGSTEAVNIATMLSYHLAVSLRVLIEDFGWLPLKGHKYTGRNRITRFMESVNKRINDIIEGDQGFLLYATETENLYGVRFKMEEE